MKVIMQMKSIRWRALYQVKLVTNLHNHSLKSEPFFVQDLARIKQNNRVATYNRYNRLFQLNYYVSL